METIKLVLFGLLGIVAIFFFINHAVFKGKLFEEQNRGYLVDFAKYGTIALVIIILVNELYNRTR
jgi:hypothetical protein